jgi:hypothetical protein
MQLSLQMKKSDMAVPNAKKRSVKVGHPKSRNVNVHLALAPESRALVQGVDCGHPLVISPNPYIAASREPGWGAHLDTFLSRNRSAFESLELQPNIVSFRDGVRLELKPGLRAGAIPLKSAVSGKISGGIVISPRFGWSGVGRVLSSTGWGSGPEFLDLPLVPGSGREVPPWVLAGPVIHMIRELLENLRPGYIERQDIRTYPRGQIVWPSYLSKQMPTGKWHQLPCKFSDLHTDPRLRQIIRWTLERIYSDLGAVGNGDPVSGLLTKELVQLLYKVVDVTARRPLRGELEADSTASPITSLALREGLRAIGWIAEERGLGGGQNLDGIAWALPLDQLWERYVESLVNNEARLSGGKLRVGRLGETVIPIAWKDSTHRALGHLVPDFVINRHDGIEIIDAKYKSHFADLDSNRWYALAQETQSAMRSDIHQILAYAATAGAASKIKATLVYPVRRLLYEDLQSSKQAESNAVIPVGLHQITLSLKAMPFGN